MKQYAVNVVLHILFIVMLTIGGVVLYQNERWFSTFVVLISIVATGMHLYYMQFRHLMFMRKFTDSIRYKDLTQAFHPPFQSKLMTEIAIEFSETLKVFRGQLLAEEVKQQYYENLLNKVDTAVLVTDFHGRIEWMNKTAASLLGACNQLPGQIIQTPSGDTRVVRLEQNGSTLEMAASCTLFTTQGKEQLLVSLKNIHSVLERNEMEAWQKLIRVLTHEIMNSITPIISLSETLSERGIPEQSGKKEYAVMLQAMQAIHRRSQGLLGFVENYRRLTRISTPIRMEVSVKEIFTDLRKLFPDEKIHFNLPDKDLKLCIDRGQIEQVLINLIKNAQESSASKEQKKISISLSEQSERFLRLTVSDNGEGILPEVIDKIFVPFFTTKNSGSGIGLSLCKQIMNLHGGSITVKSEARKGSCFTLIFPTL